MILEYSYDNINHVLDLFKQSALATLDIKTVTEKNNNPRFVMEYTLVNDYNEARQDLIRKVLVESLNERLQLTNILNQFIENVIQNNVKSFTLSFNAVQVRKCQIRYSSSFGTVGNTVTPQSNIAKLTQCLEQFDRIIVDMGVATQTIPGVFKKDGAGKSKKHVALTIQELSDVLRHALTEE